MNKIIFEIIEDWALNYLGTKHKKENMYVADKGRAVIEEFKKLGKYVIEDFDNFEFANCANWQNSGNIRPYLWIQFKAKQQINNPCSISLFVVKEDNAMNLCLATEIDDNKATDRDYENFRRTLDVSLENEENFYWECGNGDIVFDKSDAILSIKNKVCKKVKTVKIINAPYKAEETERIIYEIKKGFKDFIPLYLNIFNEEHVNKIKEDETMNIPAKNQILYGPPGTGKTYNTVVETIKILNNNLYKKYDNTKDLAEKNRIYKEELSPEFKRFKDLGQIEFVTFHQSYSYEEFVEGIKPVVPDGKDWDTEPQDVKYTGKDGIFKKICKSNLDKSYEYFLSFKNHIEDLPTFKNGNNEFTVTRIDSGICIKRTSEKESSNSTTLEKFKKVVFYECNEGEKLTSKNLFEKTGVGGGLEPQLLVLREYIRKTIEPRVLIIDEINRGNISKIFGELITLIEPDKRIGEDNAIKVTLPYSKQKFGVPKNLYIIGTMNTSDRSIASIDIALRRRFEFVEMMPKPELIADDKKRVVLENLNERISVLLDRDHQIGHSYFIGQNAGKELKDIFFDSIIPLLNEYFYGDWEKLQAILGKADKKDSFIKLIEINSKDFFANNYNDCENKYYDFAKLSEIDFNKALENAKLVKETNKKDEPQEEDSN